MIGKLLENWLDNASERSYQQVFVQILAANGYTVLHSTRHCLLEFGKDILAIAPDGIGCAFQLKGDPKGQMTIGTFRSGIQFQLVQLMSQAPSSPGFPIGTHRSYLVSNGSFSEEVQLGVSQMNASNLPSKVDLWSRGTLLDMALKVSDRLWPSEIQDSRRLLDLYMADARDILPTKTLTEMLASILSLGDPPEKMGESEFKRVLSSAAWATGIALVSFAEAENHYAVASGWSLYRGMINCVAAKYGYLELSDYQNSCRLAELAARDALAALWEEVRHAGHLVAPPALEDSVIFGWRIATLRGLLSSLYLADEREPCLDEASREDLKKWIPDGYPSDFWSEGAVGQIFTFAVALGRMGRSAEARNVILELASELIESNQTDAKLPLATPYYTPDEVFRLQLGLENKEEHMETFDGGAFLARPLFLCLVSLNMKADCQRLWADFSRLTHRVFEFANSEDYFSVRTRAGCEVSKIYPSSANWADMQLEVKTTCKKRFDDLWFQTLWWQVAPHRAEAGSMLAALDVVDAVEVPTH